MNEHHNCSGGSDAEITTTGLAQHANFQRGDRLPRNQWRSYLADNENRLRLVYNAQQTYLTLLHQEYTTTLITGSIGLMMTIGGVLLPALGLTVVGILCTVFSLLRALVAIPPEAIGHARRARTYLAQAPTCSDIDFEAASDEQIEIWMQALSSTWHRSVESVGPTPV